MLRVAYTFSCERDRHLTDLLFETMPDVPKYIFVEEKDSGLFHYDNVFIRDNNYYNGAGWEASLIKINAIKELVYWDEDAAHDDLIMYCDSDVFFLNHNILNHLKPVDFQGLKHQPLYSTFFGPWSHFSGSCHFMSFRIARKIAAMTIAELEHVRKQMKQYNLTENEDIVLSYLVTYLGGDVCDLPGNLMQCGDIENELINPSGKYSIVHLNQPYNSFLGEAATGKWDIPLVLKKKNICLK